MGYPSPHSHPFARAHKRIAPSKFTASLGALAWFVSMECKHETLFKLRSPFSKGILMWLCLLLPGVMPFGRVKMDINTLPLGGVRQIMTTEDCQADEPRPLPAGCPRCKLNDRQPWGGVVLRSLGVSVVHVCWTLDLGCSKAILHPY